MSDLNNDNDFFQNERHDDMPHFETVLRYLFNTLDNVSDERIKKNPAPKYQAFQRGLSYLKTMLESGAQMYEDNLFLSHLYNFLNLEPTIKDPESPCTIPEKSDNGIEFKNVNFSYPDCKKNVTHCEVNVINCVNFCIKPGEVVALVGENGSVKSTTEMKIFSGLKKLIKGRSALIISHRYSTVRMAGRILVTGKRASRTRRLFLGSSLKPAWPEQEALCLNRKHCTK